MKMHGVAWKVLMALEAHHDQTYDVTQTLDRLQRAFDQYGGNKLSYERLEAIVETVREQFGDVLKQEDNGSMLWEMQELIALLQKFEDTRR